MPGHGHRLPILALSVVLSVALSALSVHSDGAAIAEATSTTPTLSPTVTASPVATLTPTSSPTASQTPPPTETQTPIGWLTPTPTASATSYPTPTLSEHRAMLPIIVRHHPLTMPVGFELVNQIGGASWAVVVHGSYAYVMVGLRLMVMDVSDPQRPAVLGQTAVLQVGSLQDIGKMHIAVQERYVYVPLGDAGLSIIDVSDVAHPVEVARYEAGDVRNVVTAGNHAYVADTELGMHVLSISDPLHPRLLGLYSISSGAWDVDVADGYAYIAAGSSGLIVVSLADPCQPRSVACLQIGYAADQVTVAGTNAYVFVPRRIEIIDVSDPTRPRQVSTLAFGIAFTEDKVYATTVSGTHAYVGTALGGLRIIDVSDPASPHLLSDWGRYTYDASVTGSFAFVAAYDGLHVLTVEDPQHPVEVGCHTECAPDRVFISGDRAYVNDALWGSSAVSDPTILLLSVLDISNPRSVLRLGNCHGKLLVVAGTTAFMGSAEGVEIVDLSASTCGTVLGLLRDGGSDQVVRGQLAYLLFANRIRIVDVTDPATPFEVGSAEIAADLHGLAVSGGYAYAASWNGLFVVDVSIPSWPHVVAEVRGPETLGDYHMNMGLSVDRSLVYVLGGDDPSASRSTRGVLWVVDATDPTHPATSYTVAFAPVGWALAVAHPLVYIANWEGLRVVDLGDVGRSLFYDTPGYCQDVALRGDLIYVADDAAGLLILRPLY